MMGWICSSDRADKEGKQKDCSVVIFWKPAIMEYLEGNRRITFRHILRELIVMMTGGWNRLRFLLSCAGFGIRNVKLAASTTM
jgi:hypothetical protein